MATQDISRFLFQPTKHYSTVHMQQGRVLVDSDWNERAALEAEGLRASLVDIVCSRGTPNDGMKITNVDTSELGGTVDLPGEAEDFASYNFSIGAGSYYVGGLRLVVEPGETFLHQKDWLQLDGSDSGELPPKLTLGARNDLVYLYAWEQAVTAVEDSELREAALGGRDTSTRVRRMRRVMVRTGVTEEECGDAFLQFTSELTSTYTDSEYDGETCELRSGARLKVSFVSSTDVEDLCADSAESGYVAAENQAIRIELRDGEETPMWVWGFDNASKLYRVKIADVDEIEGTTTLTFLTEPADLPSMPRAGQVVELLDWGALLPNKEKVAEMQGAITKVTSSYDPTTKSIVIEGAMPDSVGEWFTLHEEYENPADGIDDKHYVYLRLWDRGAELVDETHPAEIELVVDGMPVALGTTGLAVKFIQGGIPGDYWVIAARPSTPEEVTPWDLYTASGGVPPHGPRRFYAPLAILAWRSPDTAVTVSDCRTKLRRLCDNICCTVTVGDGERSFGQVNDLQDAIDLVPEGGKICLLPGRHESSAVLNGRNDIVIEGCGPNSVLVCPTPASDEVKANPESFYVPVLKIVDSSNIRVQNLRIEAHSAVGISLEIPPETMSTHHVVLEDLQIFSTGSVNGGNGVYEYVAPCVAVLGATDVEIRNCDLEQDAAPGISEAVVLGGNRLRLIDSRVKAPVWSEEVTYARGGVNIRSGSYDVEIIGCIIEGGWGHGISVGHVDKFDRTPEDPVTLDEPWKVLSKPVGMGVEWLLPNGNIASIQPARGGKEAVSAPGTDEVVLPLGPVENVRIHDNVIRRMGLSGISTAEFFKAVFEWDNEDAGPVFIVASNFDICRNTIEDNVLRTNLPETLAGLRDDIVGGICLAASISPVIRENRIMRNGSENYRLPICGIGLLAAQNVVIEDNQIVDNGARFPDEGEPVPLGLRGGVVILEVTPVRGYTFAQSSTGPELWEPTLDFEGASGGSAVVMRGNEVVHLLGRALWVIESHGAVTVTGNTLESFGNQEVVGLTQFFTLSWTNGVKTVTRSMSGACVEIFGYSKALDVTWEPEQVAVIPVPSWVDVSEALEDGGNTLVSGNAIRMSWNVVGGISTAVLISTLASAVFDNNDVLVDMSSAYTGTVGSVMSDFYGAILANPQAYSYVISSVYVAGFSTGQANGNRVTEGKFDALFSVTVGSVSRTGGAAILDVVHGVSSTANILSHANPLINPTSMTGRTVIPDPLLDPPLILNAVIYPDESPPDAYVVLPNDGSIGGIGRAVIISNHS